MSHRLIRSLFEARLAGWAASRIPELRIAYQNVSFDPEDGETYLAAFVMPADTASNTLGGDDRIYTGVFQINVVTAVGKGSGAASAIVDEIADLFPLNLRLTQDTFSVLVMTPVAPGLGITSDVSCTISASFQYRADTN